MFLRDFIIIILRYLAHAAFLFSFQLCPESAVNDSAAGLVLSSSLMGSVKSICRMSCRKTTYETNVIPFTNVPKEQVCLNKYGRNGSSNISLRIKAGNSSSCCQVFVHFPSSVETT